MSNQINHKEFCKMTAALFGTFNIEASEPMVEGYYMALKDLTIDQLKTAIGKAICTAKFLPKPVELREIIFGSVKDKAQQQWKLVDGAVSGTGTWGAVMFSDQCTRKALIYMGGWYDLCRSDVDDWKWREKEFIEKYEMVSRNPEQYGDKLILNQQENLPVHFYGDRESCIKQIQESSFDHLLPPNLQKRLTDGK